MRPKAGVDGRRAAEEIDRVLAEAGTGVPLASDYDAVLYTMWVHRVARVLQTCFVDVPVERLYSEQFWRAQGPILFRAELVTQEAERQIVWLSDVRDAVRSMTSSFGGSDRAIAVLDTNVLLHHQPPSEVPWPRIVDADAVLLVVPLRVVHELDAKKYAGSKLGDRARTRIRLLAQNVDGEPHQVRPGVDIEVVTSVDLDPDAAHKQPIPPDAEIIETCEALTAYSGSNPVYLITGDLAMQIIARSNGIEVRPMPENTIQLLGHDGGESAETTS